MKLRRIIIITYPTKKINGYVVFYYKLFFHDPFFIAFSVRLVYND